MRAQVAVLGIVNAVRPSAPLASYVDHYWVSASAGASVATVLPDGRVDVVLALEPATAAVWVYGSVTRRTDIALEPGATYIGIQFRPGRARHFVDVQAHELTDRAAPGAQVLALGLEWALDAAQPLETVAAVDAALLRHLSRVQPHAGRIDHIVASLESAHGCLSVAALADQFDVSRRQIERVFLDAVGLSPKAFASILRFHHAAARIRAGAAITDAALAAGYADQSHLHHAFRRYAHLTPARYARGDVAFLQDSKCMVDEDGDLSLWKESLP